MNEDTANILLAQAHSLPTREEQIKRMHYVVSECYVEKAHIRMARYTHDVGFLLQKIEELRAELFQLRSS